MRNELSVLFVCVAATAIVFTICLTFYRSRPKTDQDVQIECISAVQHGGDQSDYAKAFSICLSKTSSVAVQKGNR